MNDDLKVRSSSQLKSLGCVIPGQCYDSTADKGHYDMPIITLWCIACLHWVNWLRFGDSDNLIYGQTSLCNFLHVLMKG